MRSSRFIDFVCAIYQSFPSTVKYFFNQPLSNTTVASISAVATNVGRNSLIGGSGPGPEDGTALLDASQASVPFVGAGQLNPSTQSFKIETESLLVVMFLFQLYSKLVQNNIPNLLPLMVSEISILGFDKVPAHLKMQFVELKGAQIKTLSFLTYLLRSFATYIRSHEESICKSIVNLLISRSLSPPQNVNLF